MDARSVARRLAICTLAASTLVPSFSAGNGFLFAQQDGDDPPAAAASDASTPGGETFSRWTSRQRSFELPFDLAEIDAATTVELYYNYNGTGWKLYERRAARDGKFVFRAEHDGAYWFVSRTIDAQNRPHPAGPLSAEMLMIVDATPPAAELAAATDAAGNVQCSWRIEDPGLAPQSLKLEYDLEGIWKPISVQLPPQQLQAGTTTLQGGVTWRPEIPLAKTKVRLTVYDAAGNLSQPIQLVELGAAVAEAAAPQAETETGDSAPPGAAPAAMPVASQRPAANPTASVPWTAPPKAEAVSRPASEEIAVSPYSRRESSQQAEEIPAPAGTPVAAAVPTVRSPTVPSPSVPSPTVAAGSPASSYQLPAPKSPSAPQAPAPADAAKQAGVAAADSGKFRPQASAVTPTEGATPWPAQAARDRAQSRYAPADTASTANTATAVPKAKPVAGGPTAGAIAPAVTGSASQYAHDAAALFDDIVAESTNVKAFQLEYDLEAIGPEGVAKVVLWVTRNRGQDWEQYAEDADHASPVNVEVTEEGLYGFRVQVTGKNGLGARPPKSGDPADIWIEIDATRPVVELKNVPYGQGPTAGKLEIYWTAEDKQLAQRPVTLRYSESPTGPWTTIAASIPNDGKFIWAIEPHTPKEVYLRLEVTDKAGNVGVAELADPVRLQPLIPKARIRGFKPVGRVPLGQRQIVWLR